MTNYKQLWNKIIKDLDNDDIVIEVKVLNTRIQDWKNLLKFLHDRFSNIIFDDNISSEINANSFPKSDNDTIKSLSLSFNYFNLTLSLYTIEEIEFFSDSVIKLNANNIEPLFSFCEMVSHTLSKNIYIYCEASDHRSLYYNHYNKLWEY
ncbi:hypothetical protein PFY10_15975 [Chryseobacterium daecheongense]|nr:hypothetical protein PFY10_15975 [Chryseobacterium daecheongense]